MRDFDGIRHYLEFLPFLCLLGGAGFHACAKTAASRWSTRPERGKPGVVGTAGLLLVSGTCLVPLVLTHPNGICYTNVLGRSIVQAAADPSQHGATDYWGNSYWQGLDWLNEHADANASLLVPVGWRIVNCAGPLKLRSDISLLPRKTAIPRDTLTEVPLYVMSLVRRGEYGPFRRGLDASSPPAHEIRVHDQPILRIHRLDHGLVRREIVNLWNCEMGSRLARGHLQGILKEHPEMRGELFRVFETAQKDDVETLERELRLLFPEDAHDDLHTALWLWSR